MTCMWQLVRGCLQPFSWLLAAAGTPPCSLACRHIALVFASITALLFLCLCVSSPPSAREQGPPQSRVILIMPAKTLFPSKVPGLECAQIFLGATAQHKCRATRDFILFFFKILFIYFYRGEGREKERERNLNVWSSLVRPPTGDLARNPGMCPDWELNWSPFASQLALSPLSQTSQGGYWIF